MKSARTSRLARMGGRLGLALACGMIAGQASAVPYASQIRFAETDIVQSLGTDLLYTLNEDADEVTVQVYNETTDTVIRTYTFTAPDPETQMGRHAVNWDGRDESNNQLPLGSDELVIRVNVKKVDNSTEWTRLTGNGSGIKVTEKTSLFNGFSSNDILIPKDPTSDQFGLVLTSHSYNAAAPGGLVLFGTDLETIVGDGGGPDAVKGQHNALQPGSFGVWNMNFDPLNPNLVWWAGQTGTHRVGVTDISGINPEDMQTVADEVWTVSSPRGVAIGVDGNGDRVGFLAVGTEVQRLVLDTVYPYTGLFPETLTAAQIDGATRYSQEVELDADGNLYWLSRWGDTGGGADEALSTLWRWDKATVEAAPGVPLDETNAAWHVIMPTGMLSANTMEVDPVSGNVYIGANVLSVTVGGEPVPNEHRGIFLVGNVADATLPSKPYQIPLENQILNYSDTTQFPADFSTSPSGHGVGLDWQGNMYVTTRTQEEIHSFAPPGNGASHDIDTASPAGYFANIAFSQTNVVFVNSTATPDGVAIFNTIGDAINSFGPGENNNGFAGTNRIEIQDFGPFDEELPDLTGAIDSDDFEIVATNGPALVLQQSSSWDLSTTVSIDGLVIAASSTNTPTGSLVTSTAGTQTISNSWITALPAGASSYTEVGNIPSNIANGTGSFDGSLVRAGDGLDVNGGTVELNGTIVSQHANGVLVAGGSVTLDGAKAVSNQNAGIAASSGTVGLASGSEVSFNATGLTISGSAEMNADSAYATPNQIVDNSATGIAYSSSGQYALRNTLIHGSDVGFDLLSGGYNQVYGFYFTTDVIISGCTTAGLRIADGLGFSAARMTFYDNGTGVLDLGTRGGFWSLEFQDTIIAGAGDLGIDSSSAGGDSIRMDHVALVTDGPDALATASNAPAGGLSEIDAPIINFDPVFLSTSYSPNRLAPDFYLAPSSADYRLAAAPDGTQQGEGSPNENLGGGSRWRIGPFKVVATVYESNFETDQTSNFTISEFIPGDSSIDFNYDYSTFAQDGGGFPQEILPSPFNTGTGTRGVRIATNIAGGATNGITATLNSIPPETDMKITLDTWHNFGGTFSTEAMTFGASRNASLEAFSGGNYFSSVNEPFDGMFFSIAAEGGQAQDYRYYDGNGTEGAFGNNAARANFLGTGAVDNNEFGSVFPAPPYQGTGWPGKAWNRWEVDIFQGHVRLHVVRGFDQQRILLCDWFLPNDGVTLEDMLPHFGTNDLFASLANPTSDQFVLVDYLRVQTIEPGEEEPPPGMLGDINGDEIINVADVTALANAIAANNLPPMNIGDVNGDEVINNADVAALAGMIVDP